MSESEKVEQTQEVQVEEQLSEIKQLAREGKFKEGPSASVFCVECELKAYPAEIIWFDKLPYHINCFQCNKCTKKIEGGFNAAKFEHKVYCRGCFQSSGFNRLQAQVKWTPKASTGTPAASGQFAGLGGGGIKCTACEKTAYSAETIYFDKRPFHAECLKCSECSVKCTLSQANQFEGDIFCTSCWNRGGYARKQVEQKSSGPSSGNYSAITLKLGGGGIKCTTCDKTSYPAETVYFEQKPYHSDCLKCSECSVKCTLSQANQFEGKLFCTKCWNVGGYVQKQRDAAKTWKKSDTPVAADPRFGGVTTKCFSCEKTVYPAETISYEGRLYHNTGNCFKCTHCSSRIETVNVAQHKKGDAYCNRCFQELQLWRAENA